MATINEAYACYVYWRETDIAKGAEFIIMWSDGTWETIKTPITTYYVNDKTCKQFMELNKVVSSKMTKKRAMAFIQAKFKKYLKNDTTEKLVFMWNEAAKLAETIAYLKSNNVEFDIKVRGVSDDKDIVVLTTK